MYNNNSFFQNDISQQQIDQALLRLNTLLKEEPPKQEKQKFKKPILIDDTSIVVSSQHNYTSQTKMTSEQINHFVERMNDKYKQTQNKIIEQRKDQIYSPIKVNNKSQIILKQKFKNNEYEYQSLYERAKIKQIEKQEKIKENQKLKILEEMTSIKIKQSDSKSVDQFLHKMDYWREKKTQNIQNQQQEKIERELEGVTFKPRLNSLSAKIVKNRDNDDILDRFQKSYHNKYMNEQKLLIDELKKTPFTPKLNKNSIIINNQIQKQQQLRNYNYFLKQQTVKQQQRDPILINGNHKKQISKEVYNSKQSKSLTPDHVRSKYSTEKQKDDNSIRQTPLKQNKIIPNVQEVKYNPNLKFLMTLAQKELNYSSLF